MFGKIYGTGSYTPDLVWDNDKLAQIVDTNNEWIVDRTGISRRHLLSEGETTSDMAVKAAKAALADADIDPEEIDLIIVATLSSNTIMPCTACEVQKEIGAVKATCFDLNAACTGFLFALNTAQMYIAQGMCGSALIIGAEGLSNLIDWQDRSTCILFGDGAGAVVLKAEKDATYEMVMKSDGSRGNVLTCASRNQKIYEDKLNDKKTYIQMDGGEVFKFAVSKVPLVIKELLKKADVRRAEIDYYVLHQANIRIVKSVAKRLRLPMDKFPCNMEEYGNTSSASIPILLDEMNKKGMLKQGMKIVISGFGGGLTFGAGLIRL